MSLRAKRGKLVAMLSSRLEDYEIASPPTGGSQ
jgi:hypothetical protein